ncbi:unnamed protein product [Arabis nemorensis]|uniref:Uncharacterized protein n=1 Tax=Arabis nemorensis TaxID=586526 RepID=A0A565BIY8_9BRAS|nr:unnamed protein product [Arabis nemorensis]
MAIVMRSHRSKDMSRGCSQRGRRGSRRSKDMSRGCSQKGRRGSRRSNIKICQGSRNGPRGNTVKLPENAHGISKDTEWWDGKQGNLQERKPGDFKGVAVVGEETWEVAKVKTANFAGLQWSESEKKHKFLAGDFAGEVCFVGVCKVGV